MGNLKDRTKAMAIAAFRFVQALPRDYPTLAIAKQLVRSATSVAANYRSALRARSRRDFINKLGIVEEEADETLFWLEMLEELKIGDHALLKALIIEVNELVAIFVASRVTAKMKQTRSE